MTTRALAFLSAQRRAHVARLRELTRTESESDATIGDVIAHLDADLTWLVRRLEELRVT